MQENPMITVYRQKITLPGSANPKEISQQCTPATHTAVHCQLGIPYLKITKGSWIHLLGGRGSPCLSSALWRQYNPVYLGNGTR